MFRNALKLFGIKGPKAQAADAVLTDVANGLTNGAAGKVDEAVQSVKSEVDRRKRKSKS